MKHLPENRRAMGLADAAGKPSQVANRALRAFALSDRASTCMRQDVWRRLAMCAVEVLCAGDGDEMPWGNTNRRRGERIYP
eukprot:5050758-Pyramimonas_sp.AAC.1